MRPLLRPVAFILSSLLMAGILSAQVQVPEKEQRSSHKSFLLDPKLVAKEQETGERQDDAAARIDWWRQHLGGEITTEFKERLIREMELERSKYPGIFLGDPGAPVLPAAVSGSSWTPIGPTASNKTQNGIQLTVVDSGRARTILPVPGNANTVYFLTSGGGLWKTTNFTSNPPTWTALTDGVGSTSGGSAAFGGAHPTNVLDPNVVYVGFGDPFDPGVGGIMAKTSDGGSTFPGATKKVLPGVTKICDVKVDFSGGADMILVGTNAGLFRSTDGGLNYSSVASLATGQVWSIVQASTGWLASVDVSGTTTFWKSTDGGATWSNSTAVTTPSSIGRTTLGIGAPGDAVVYAFATTTNAGAQKDLYRSPDSGATWVATNTNSSTTPVTPNSDQGNNDYMHGQAFYNQMLLVDPSDATRNTVYVGGNLSIGKSVNGGGTWNVITNWLAQFGLQYAHADHHASAFFQGSPNRAFFGSDGGMFTTTDGGTTFDDTKNKGLQTHLIYAMTCGFNGGADKNSVLVGLQDNGTRLRVGSTTVFDQTKGGDGFGVGWSQANNAWTLGSYVYNAIARCTTNPPDDQSKWGTFTSGLTPTDSASYYFVTPIIGAPATSDAGSAHPGNNFYTYGNSGSGTNSGKIFTTAPTGTSWTAIGTPGSGGISSGRFVRAESHGIGVSPVDLDHIAAAGNGGVVLISTNATSGSPTWTERAIASLGVPTWPGFNSNIAWANNNVLYLCSVDSGTPAAPHLVKSINGGAAWTAANNGLPNVPVVKLAVDPGDATGNTVYAGTWLGLYRTTDGGANWAPFGSGQPQGYVSDIYVAPDSSFLRASFYGRGVFEMVSGLAVVATITSPASPVTLVKSATQSYSGSVTNFTSTSQLNWTVAAGGGSFSPTSTTNGSPTTVFTAGTTANTFLITATSQEDGTAKATQNVTVVDPTSVNVSVAPAAPTVVSGATQAFTATVTPITNTAVTWSVTGVGSINGSGVYTAPAAPPATPQTVTITATSVAAPTRTGAATVTVPVLSITVAPTPVNVPVGFTQQFTATVNGSTNTTVTWTVFSGGGSVNAAGLYTAPGSTGSAVVRATSVADPTKFADAAVTIVVVPVSISISPTSTIVITNTTKQFTATVSNTVNTNVTWTVQSGGGSVNASGLYSAPGAPGLAVVRATSVADNTKFADAAVTIQNPVTISISPTEAWVQPTGSTTFTGTVSTGQPLYSVVEGSTGGTITSGGVYTAPATPGDYHVKATAQADPTKTATALVHVQVIAVAVSPNATTVQTGTTQAFTAMVTGNPNQTVNWSVLEGVSGGSVDSSGLYTAPATPGTYHVRAASALDGTKSDTATVTVQSSAVLTVAVAPAVVTVAPLANQTFTATVTNGPAGVTWSVLEAGGGSINAAGLYTAPVAAGVYHVVARSTADNTKSGQATITVPPVTISANPGTATVLTGGTVVLNGLVSTGGINWTASSGSLSAATGSTVTFTAPAAAGTSTVTATSSVDATKTAAVTINVKTKDQNADTVIDVLDLAYFARYYGTANSAADLNGDGIVDELDINIFLTGF